MCLRYKIYHRMDHPMNEHLNHFVAVRNIRASAALGEVVLEISGRKAYQFSRSLLLAAGRL